MVRRIVLVLGDQLSDNLSALREADPSQDIVLMAEVMGEAGNIPHHPQKIALIFAAMRKFAAHLQAAGWQVAYTRLDAPQNTGSIEGEIARIQQTHQTARLLATQPGDWRLRQLLETLGAQVLPDDRFIASEHYFAEWAKGRKSLRMEYFYREMRRKTGILMQEDGPVGGKWNYDAENRKAPPKSIPHAGPRQFQPDAVTQDVLALVKERFSHHFGELAHFSMATTPQEAQAALSQFIRDALPYFGDFQDAMLRDNAFLHHACISAYLNIGLLDPLATCQAIERAYHEGHAPLNAVEGFIRQILGWREYMRGIYAHCGPDYVNSNALGHERPLPALFWGGETKMSCLSHVIAQTKHEAYAHHIQRLMVSGNFALLVGVAPKAVHEWFLSVYIDAFEWVEMPNTLGMSQFADGGMIASKPYVSSGAYINRMSDYCKTCHYKVAEKDTTRACPFNALYWDFLDRHAARFRNNPRMGQIYRNWERMGTEKQAALKARAQEVFQLLEQNAI